MDLLWKVTSEVINRQSSGNFWVGFAIVLVTVTTMHPWYYLSMSQ